MIRETDNITIAPHQAAVLAGVSVTAIQNWCNSGMLEYHCTPGRHRRINKVSLLKLLGYDVDTATVEQLENPDLLSKLYTQEDVESFYEEGHEDPSEETVQLKYELSKLF